MVKAARVQRARTRDLVTGIDRQVAAYDAHRPERIARDERIKTAKRAARRALRARAVADRARQTADARAGAALRRVMDEGLSMSEAAVLLDLSRSAAKRLVRLGTGTTDPWERSSSTEPTDDRALGDLGAHGEHSGTATSGATNEGNL